MAPNVTSEHNLTGCDHSPLTAQRSTLTSVIVLTGIVCITGTFGNGLNLVLMVQRVVRQRFARDKGVYFGFICLALSDTIICLISLPRVFIRENKILFDNIGFSVYYQLFGAGLTSVFILWSTWLTVLLAIGRCLAVCDPLSRRRLFHVSTKWAVVTSMTSLILALLFHIPSLLLYRISTLTLPGFKHSCYMVATRDLWTSEITTIHDWVRIVFGYLIPFIVLLICNGYLIIALRRSEKAREELSAGVDTNRKRLSNKITPTLLAIIIAFLALMTPSEILEFVFGTLQTSHSTGRLYMRVRQIVNLLQITNFGMNFALHLGINRMYRKALQGICSSDCRSGKSRSLNRQTSFDMKNSIPLTTTVTLRGHSGTSNV